MTSHSAQNAGEKKNILLIQGHMVTGQNFPELTALIYILMDLLTLSDLGLPALGQNELNDGLNVVVVRE